MWACVYFGMNASRVTNLEIVVIVMTGSLIIPTSTRTNCRENLTTRLETPTRVSMEVIVTSDRKLGYNIVTGRIQPTFIGVIIHLLSTSRKSQLFLVT